MGRLIDHGDTGDGRMNAERLQAVAQERPAAELDILLRQLGPEALAAPGGDDQGQISAHRP